MAYMEDYEDYLEIDTISYSIYESVVNEKDAEIEKLQSRVEELEDYLEEYKKLFKNFKDEVKKYEKIQFKKTN